ncbi:carbon storage regulator [Pseudoflavonifractor sp. 524-17]|uniref:carbon storage regulator n=1 Tax=Pseudoflavonifractor sp. 524-17 TaxID=2304577 RepID=UPI00137AE506|nr:carbon storage regulator [Pseudoflavonifractor sp. 524-17]NCE63981.1 carbon storage regulator [Pseudoflavonifractor sp. 524-17]
MLALTVREGDYITIGDDIVVQVVKTGELFRLAIDAPRSLDIRRGKVHEARTGSVPAAIQKLRNKTERS